MEIHILLTFLCLAVGTCRASLIEGSGGNVNFEGSSGISFGKEIQYWIEQLGDDTKMPKAITESLRVERIDVEPQYETKKVGLFSRKLGDDNGPIGPKGKHADVHVGWDGVHVDAHKKLGEDNGPNGPKGKHADVHVGWDGVHVDAHKKLEEGRQLEDGKNADVDVGMGGVVVKGKKKPVYVAVKPGLNPFDYRYDKNSAAAAGAGPGASDDTSRQLFFLEKSMKPRQLLTMHFTHSTNGATFLPREKAESIPFTTKRMPEILDEFSVEPGTDEAKTIENTIKGCESKGIRGEKKYCATSLESMIDFVKSNLGKNVKAVSTEAEREDDKVQKYTIIDVRKVAGNDEATVCHKQNYAFAVFLCHKTEGTSVYTVSLSSENRSKVKAMAICHKDTSAWNPNHMAFRALKVTPGSAPICHFLPEDHVVWVRI